MNRRRRPCVFRFEREATTPPNALLGVAESRMLTEQEMAAIRANLFEAAHYLVEELPVNLWHRDLSGALTATRPHSSQALALDVLGTIRVLPSLQAIAAAWADHLKLPSFGPVSIQPEFMIERALLGEPKSTQVDALIRGDAASALFECKFTERDGGSCSRTAKRELPDGRKVAQCNGSYAPQKNPHSTRRPLTEDSCALTAKGVRYWEYIPDVLGVRADVVHPACPFAGGAYQWMRNLVAAHALTQSLGRPHAFVIAYADGPFAMPRKVKSKAWRKFTAGLAGTVALREVSFQSLIAVARHASAPSDTVQLDRLAQWVEGKVREAAP